MTNYEKIKSMTLEEMAKLLCKKEQSVGDCSDCPFVCRPIMCQGAVLVRKKWLESETGQGD